jgi:2-polyprenyl-3-methyl-5-hydroxy-6-metoxy-1,4-benzoquinol methylase
MKDLLRRVLTARTRRRLRSLQRRVMRFVSVRPEVDALYTLLYQAVHDEVQALDVASVRTSQSFDEQWSRFPSGHYLLTDPWFAANVGRILSEEELQIASDWFRGKEVLDAGCGNGRWAVGFAQLGANVTAVDASNAAIEATAKALAVYPVAKAFHVAPLEELARHLPLKQYDLVFCWGVLHHTRRFAAAFNEVLERVRPGGLLYLYLYGRETLPLRDDLELFKVRLRYQLMSDVDREKFLLKKARGNREVAHNLHDLYAPLINRRFEFADIARRLRSAGFTGVTRTIQHTELHIRAVKGDDAEAYSHWILPVKEAPYWFQHHEMDR